VPEQLACPRFNCNTNHRASCSPGWRTAAGKIGFAELPNGIDDRRIANPTLTEFARIKTNSSGLITPKAGWNIRLSQTKVAWWTRPGSNRRPPHCERGARDTTACNKNIGHRFSSGVQSSCDWVGYSGRALGVEPVWMLTDTERGTRHTQVKWGSLFFFVQARANRYSAA
jgi:hypothetical protein